VKASDPFALLGQKTRWRISRVVIARKASAKEGYAALAACYVDLKSAFDSFLAPARPWSAGNASGKTARA